MTNKKEKKKVSPGIEPGSQESSSESWVITATLRNLENGQVFTRIRTGVSGNSDESESWVLTATL